MGVAVDRVAEESFRVRRAIRRSIRADGDYHDVVCRAVAGEARFLPNEDCTATSRSRCMRCLWVDGESFETGKCVITEG